MTTQKRAFSWLNPKLKVHGTGKFGRGVFVNEKIRKGERLAIFGGHIISLEEEASLPKRISDSGVQVSEEFVLTSIENEEDADCFNHSCEPNAGFRGQIFLVAIKDIEMSEQITFDYAMALFGDEYKMKCLCGTRKCRGYVTAEDWKLPELQNKYEGYFQYFLQEKINKLKGK